MGMVIRFLNGRAYKQSELLDEGKYPVLRVGNLFSNNSWYYSNLELDADKYCESGDLLYAWAASLGAFIWNGKKSIFHYHIWKLEFDESLIDKEFLYYFLQNDVKDIQGSLTNSTMPHISMEHMKKRILHLPDMEKQKKLANKLRQFDKICESLTDGIPAEIEARKKQYEYYRDKLLSFPEKKSGKAE